MNQADFHSLVQSTNAFESSIENLTKMLEAELGRLSGPISHELERARSAGAFAIVRAMRSVWTLSLSMVNDEIRKIEEEPGSTRQAEIATLQRVAMEMASVRSATD